MTLHLKSRGYPFRPRLLFSSFIVVGVGFPNCVLFQERTGFLFSTEVCAISSGVWIGGWLVVLVLLVPLEKSPLISNL